VLSVTARSNAASRAGISPMAENKAAKFCVSIIGSDPRWFPLLVSLASYRFSPATLNESCMRNTAPVEQ